MGSSTFIRYSGLLATGGQMTRTTGTSYFPSLRRFAAIRPWTDRQWLLRGVPIRQPTAALSLCTDASGLGWGAHLLPSFAVCSGLWAPHEEGLLCNEQELLAILRAVTFWVSHLRGLCLMVLSDSTTVCAYIRKQRRTKSRALCHLALDLLTFCDVHSISLHIPGRLNVIVDGLSR